MNKKVMKTALCLILCLCLYGCGAQEEQQTVQEKRSMSEPFTRETTIEEVADYPAFGDYGRLMFPIDEWYYDGDTLGTLSLTWYNNMDPDKTVEIANYFRENAEAGNAIFYDIYTEEEKAADPAKEGYRTVLFQRRSRSTLCRVQCRRRFCLCGSHAGQLPSRFRTF